MRVLSLSPYCFWFACQSMKRESSDGCVDYFTNCLLLSSFFFGPLVGCFPFAFHIGLKVVRQVMMGGLVLRACLVKEAIFGLLTLTRLLTDFG